MVLWLFLLFTAVPLLELWLLVWIGTQTSALTAIALVLATGVIGATLARWQGWRVMQRVQSEMRQGILPADAMTDGVLVLVAGLLLITPGILTDAVGLGLLLPPVRALLRRQLRRWMKTHMQVESTGYWHSSADSAPATGDKIIDAHIVTTEVVVDDDPQA